MDHEHGFQDAVVLSEAIDRFQTVLEPIERREVRPLDQASDRVLANDVEAERNVPHYDRAAMDGYAVLARDTHGASKHSPVSLQVADELQPGGAVRVHTGSALPSGADAVVMIEHTAPAGNHIEVRQGVAAGRHVGKTGEDIAAGELALQSGHYLQASEIAFLKSLEVSTVEVYERPHVAVLPTGEELVQTDPKPGQVIETNGVLVATAARVYGASVEKHDVVTDDPAELETALHAIADADLIVTTGGSSVGARDYLPEVVESIGSVLVHGVAIQPGHPVGIGVIADDTPIVMLPGYPVSCAINTRLFVREAIRTLGHLPELPERTIECRLTEKITSKVGRRTFTRVNLTRAENEVQARPTLTSGAGILSSLAQTDAVVEVPESLEGYNAGERVTATVWEV